MKKTREGREEGRGVGEGRDEGCYPVAVFDLLVWFGPSNRKRLAESLDLVDAACRYSQSGVVGRGCGLGARRDLVR